MYIDDKNLCFSLLPNILKNELKETIFRKKQELRE